MSEDTTVIEQVPQVVPEPKKYYNEAGQEVLFPGGPTIAQRDYWKQVHTNIYATDFMDEVIIWRGINRAEYKRLFSENSGTDELLFEEILTSKVILWPAITQTDLIGKKAGIPGTIVKQLLEVSGFNAPPPIPL